MNDTPGDSWHAGRYATDARFVSAAGAGLIDWLQPQPGEQILDLGCGDGALGLQIRQSGAEVFGLDSSPSMVAAARARGLQAALGRAEALAFEAAFDAVFSNAALHWVPEAEAVLRGVARALRPGGRLVVEQGGVGNVAAVHRVLVAELARGPGVVTDLSDIWYFPEPDAHAALLGATGFEVEDICLFERPTPVGADLGAWLRTLAGPVLARVDAALRDEFVARVCAWLEPELRGADGIWTLDYVRLRYRARKP